MSKFEMWAIDAYQAIVRAAGSDGISLQDLHKRMHDKFEEDYAEGRVTLPSIMDSVKAVVSRVDTSSKTKSRLRHMAVSLETPSPEFFDLPVIVGSTRRRKLGRFLDEADLQLILSESKRNLDSVQQAYDEDKDALVVLTEALKSKRCKTLGELVGAR